MSDKTLPNRSKWNRPAILIGILVIVVAPSLWMGWSFYKLSTNKAAARSKLTGAWEGTSGSRSQLRPNGQCRYRFPSHENPNKVLRCRWDLNQHNELEIAYGNSGIFGYVLIWNKPERTKVVEITADSFTLEFEGKRETYVRVVDDILEKAP